MLAEATEADLAQHTTSSLAVYLPWNYSRLGWHEHDGAHVQVAGLFE